MPGRERPLRKVLVANRGEIAVRILRALRELGIRSAAVYSEPDRRGLPVLLADEAHRIGPAASAESYLRAEALVELAREIGADAIHPGYGFLAENAEFAAMCAAAGLVFIGPPPEAMAAMGSKIESRRLMRAAGVPVVPGGEDALDSLDEAAAFAASIGYPVMLKAAAGGGGKGMRRVAAADGPGGGLPRRALRGARPASATTGSTSRSSSSGRATSRSRSSATPTASWCRWASASARCSGATRRSSRRRRRRW